MIFRACRC